ncbi:DUF1627 domain-containing protein [Salmonella enterica]|nr:DUF1627 domain-containing protein [Salmonella enterica]
MSNETVLDALKAMGKATAREIAARLGIEVRDALEMLREQQEPGRVEFLNGYWFLSGDVPAVTALVKTDSEKPVKTTEAAVKIGEHQLTEAIKKHGPQTADDLSALFSITSRRVASTLAYALNKGRLIRVNQNGKFHYCLPDENLPELQEIAPVGADAGKPGPQPEAVKLPEPEITKKSPVESVAKVVQSIPSFTEKRPDHVIFPSLHVANRELRRAKSQVQKWARVCAALRELNNPDNRRLLAQFSLQGEGTNNEN